MGNSVFKSRFQINNKTTQGRVNNTKPRFIKINSLLIPDTFKPQGPHSDQLAMLADDLAYRTSCRETYQQGAFINFPGTDWKRINSRRYSDIKDAAIEQGLIDTNNSYSSSQENKKGVPFPKSIRLTGKHRASELRSYKPSAPFKRGTAASIRIHDDDEVGMWLASWLDTFDLPDDLDYERIESLCESVHARNCLVASERRLRQKRLHASRCAYGRFHSNFTNMKSELRNELTYDGVQLVGVDIANSQPALLPYVLGRHIGYLSQIDYDLAKESEIFLHSLGSSTGKFYERAGVSLNLPPSPQSRQQIKVSFFQSLYGEVSTTERSDLFRLFREVSEPFADAILDIKQKNYRTLAHQLQVAESDIVIDTCCRSLMNQYPHMPVLTVHDEIMTTPEFINKAKIELQHAFYEKCGYFCAFG